MAKTLGPPGRGVELPYLYAKRSHEVYLMPRYRSMVAENLVRPTEHQIAENVIVIPRPFRDKYCLDVDWEDFTLDAFGIVTHHRTLDYDRRIGIPIRNQLRYGGILRLEVRNGIVCVAVEEVKNSLGNVDFQDATLNGES